MNCRLLADDILCKITQRNNIRRAYTCDPTVKLLHEDITSGIHLIQAHIPPLSNCISTGEEHSPFHNSKQTKHTHATRVQNTTLYSDGTTYIKQHRRKEVQPKGSPCENNHCGTRYEQSF